MLHGSGGGGGGSGGTQGPSHGEAEAGQIRGGEEAAIFPLDGPPGAQMVGSVR